MKRKLSRLLEETNESYYWMGFLMADGSFAGNRLTLGLSSKDSDHLKKLYNYIGCDNTIHENLKVNSSSFSVMDAYSVPLLKEKFQINNKKTYNPPSSLDWMEDDLRYSFIIGFIDGDGSIGKQYGREDAILRIKLHSSWLGVLDDISTFINGKINVPTIKAKINNQGYGQITFANHILLKNLKNKTIELSLPVLERKWSIINENYTNKNEIAKYRIETVRKMMESGSSNKEIREALDLKPSALSNLQKRNGLR